MGNELYYRGVKRCLLVLELGLKQKGAVVVGNCPVWPWKS